MAVFRVHKDPIYYSSTADDAEDAARAVDWHREVAGLLGFTLLDPNMLRGTEDSHELYWDETDDEDDLEDDAFDLWVAGCNPAEAADALRVSL